MELFPQEFRAVVALNAPTNLTAWLWVEPDSQPFRTARPVPLPDITQAPRRNFFSNLTLPKLAVTDDEAAARRPVFIIQEQGKAVVGSLGGSTLRRRLEREGAWVDYLSVDASFATRQPAASGQRGCVYEDR